MANTQELIKKWAPVLDAEGATPITDKHRRGVTAQLLENQEVSLREERVALFEAAPTNAGGAGISLGAAGTSQGGTVAGFDPILISLVRRAMPAMIAYDMCGVQPMTMPTGLIFAMKSRYATQGGTEALFNEADSAFSGTGTQSANLGDGSTTITKGAGYTAAVAEAQTGSGTSPTNFGEMAFSIEKTSVTAKSRALKAEYSVELAQDLKAVHGLDAEAELSNILSQEILNEINREVIRTIYLAAKPGAQVGTATAGTFDLDVDSNGRWSVEKFKGLLFQIEREANAIYQQTRRGRGNFIVCSADVASALAMAGVLDYAPALSTNLNVDEASSTFAGVLNGKYKVYIDPFAANQTTNQFLMVGYKGTSAFDAGAFYCPYVPLSLYRAVDPATFQPKIAFRTRYGFVANPFAAASVATDGLTADTNTYFRRVKVTNLM
jgi:hypothetical protein